MQNNISSIALAELNNSICIENEQEYDINDYLADISESNPAVYVGTYAKYNGGSLKGAWLDITAFEDFDEFISVCKFLHKDEEDPELMFQDFENFPDEWYSESCMDEDTFDKIKEYAELDNHEQEAYCIYIDGGLGNDDLESFREHYAGQYDSEEDYARELVDECYDLDKMMGNLSYYFDYRAYARDLFMEDYYFEDGYVFRRY